MTTVLMIDRIPHKRMNGVARYMVELAKGNWGDSVRLNVLYRGREISAEKWLEKYAPPQNSAELMTKLNKRYLLPHGLAKTNADIIFYPYHNLPRGWMAGNKPIILSLHGAAALLENSWGVEGNRADKIRRDLAAGKDRICHYITVSEWSKREISQQFSIPLDKISVVYHGVDHDLFRPNQTPSPQQQPFILHVGPCSPRKNVDTLVKAFAKLTQNQSFTHRLALVGRNDSDRRRILDLAQSLGISDKIDSHGVVTDQTLAMLYRNADLFVFPSFYEGFGMPILEAMASGTPVITSNQTAIPEVAGAAAILVAEIQNAEILADKIEKSLSDNVTQNLLIRSGIKKAKTFAWTRSIHQHESIFKTKAHLI